MMERHYIITSEQHGYQYRVMPNPDTYRGYAGGAQVQYRDGTADKWKEHGFIAPECLRDMADALRMAADEAAPETGR